jgi:flagellar basal body-associated protein FliL
MHFIYALVAGIIFCTIGCVAIFRYSKSEDPEEEQENKKHNLISYVDQMGRIHYRDNSHRKVKQRS